MRKVYTVIGSVAYAEEDTLGIYTSKDAALRAAKKVAKRPVNYHSDLTNYDYVTVYAANVNVEINGFGGRDEVWNSECQRRVERDNTKSYGKKIYSKNKVDGDGYSVNDPTRERY